MKTTKGMTRKQLIMVLEGLITNDNVCITESDMCAIFSRYADGYEAKADHNGDVTLTLTSLNDYWLNIRPFLPRKGDRLEGFKCEP